MSDLTEGRTPVPAPSIGRIVHYRLSEQDADAINRRYSHTARHLNEHRERADGSQIHFGNTVTAGQSFPAIVVRTFADSALVNLQVFLDGNDTFWATSRRPGEDDGQWMWPKRG